MQIIIMRLQHWTLGYEQIIIQVLHVGMQVCKLRIFICSKFIYIRFMYMYFDVMVTFMIDVG